MKLNPGNRVKLLRAYPSVSAGSIGTYVGKRGDNIMCDFAMDRAKGPLHMSIGSLVLDISEVVKV